MVSVVVSQASRERVQQHPVTKRNNHHPEERRPMDQKDNNYHETRSFQERRGKGRHIRTVIAKLGPKITRDNTELRDLLRAVFKQSLKDNTGYQYRYTGVTRPLKGTAFLFIDKGGCRGIVMPRS